MSRDTYQLDRYKHGSRHVDRYSSHWKSLKASREKMNESRLPKVIPPRSLVVLAQFDSTRSPSWKNQTGRLFRVGFYNPNDGLNCVWLVNSAGEYEQTVDQSGLMKHFIVLKLSNESDLFGKRRRALKAIRQADLPTYVLAETN